MCACACVDTHACLCPMSARICAHSVKHTHTHKNKVFKKSQVIKNSNKLYIYKMLACRIHAFLSFKTRVNRIDLHAHFHNAAVTVCKRDGEGVLRCVCARVCVRACVRMRLGACARVSACAHAAV